MKEKQETDNSADKLEALLSAAKKGDMAAAFNLGVLYEKGGEDFERDLKSAVKWFKKAADAGHTWSQVVMGDLHANGVGVPKSKKRACEWYTKATSQNDDMDIIAEVASRYYHGFGHGCDWFWANGEEAARLAKIAAENGNAEGLYRLAEMTVHDWHVTGGMSRAKELYEQAAKQGHEMAQEMLDHYFGKNSE